MIDKSKISADVLCQVGQARYCQCVQYDADFGFDTMSGELMQTQNRLVEGVPCLNDVIMQGCVIGVKRNPEAQVRMADGCKP